MDISNDLATCQPIALLLLASSFTIDVYFRIVPHVKKSASSLCLCWTNKIHCLKKSKLNYQLSVRNVNALHARKAGCNVACE